MYHEARSQLRAPIPQHAERRWPRSASPTASSSPPRSAPRASRGRGRPEAPARKRRRRCCARRQRARRPAVRARADGGDGRRPPRAAPASDMDADEAVEPPPAARAARGGDRRPSAWEANFGRGVGLGLGRCRRVAAAVAAAGGVPRTRVGRRGSCRRRSRVRRRSACAGGGAAERGVVRRRRCVGLVGEAREDGRGAARGRRGGRPAVQRADGARAAGDSPRTSSSTTRR